MHFLKQNVFYLWQNYNVIPYDEKVMDGFYNVYIVPTSGNVDFYEVISVNSDVDVELTPLENNGCTLFEECSVSKLGPFWSGLIHKLADLAVNRMGGPVGSADKITKNGLGGVMNCEIV